MISRSLNLQGVYSAIFQTCLYCSGFLLKWSGKYSCAQRSSLRLIAKNKEEIAGSTETGITEYRRAGEWGAGKSEGGVMV